ncbi:MAG: mannonate dehydratase [Salinivirgaceae bacterium]|nr:mannonate dehydratase [Salinivirgaceae bacterium]
MALEKTWRWFGPNDKITLDMLVQMGVEGVVTALHHLPIGVVWTKEEIMKLKNEIESHGLRWSVVESLPVSEDIKICGPNREQHIANYKESLKNLGECGIDTVCYNFMPVLDWCRTSLTYKHNGGGEGLYFDYYTFVAFDVFMLERPNAKADYDAETLQKAEAIFKSLSKEDVDKLVYNIIVVTQGFVNGVIDGSVKDPKGLFLEYISKYKNITKEQYRANMKAFIDDVVPTCEQYNVNLCVHPDDPPFPVLGMPRIVGCADDLRWLRQANPSLRNGITYCTGSLSGRPDNDLVAIAEEFADAIHFVHLRNTQFIGFKSFYESGHLKGSLDMPGIVNALLKEQHRRIAEGRKDIRMPFRPDHGIRILTDLDNDIYNAGYPLCGRMRGLSEISGLMAGIEYNMK